MTDTFVSNAQNFEDVMLWRVLGHVERGFYIDVGAQHPVVYSVSLAFYERGWRGVHVEPVAQYAELLRRDRPDEEVIQAAVGNREGLLVFHEIPETGLSTANAEVAARHAQAGYGSREKAVPCVTLDSILARYTDRQVHWLKIDVEGYELKVIEGWTCKAPLPWVVVVESTAPMTSTDTSELWEQLVLAHGYSFTYFDGINRFYVSAQHPELRNAFGAPPNVFDHFVVGRETDFARDLAGEITRLQRRESELATELQQVSTARDRQRADYEEAVARHAEETRQKDAERTSVESLLRETGERAATLGEELRGRASEVASLIDRLAAYETERARREERISRLEEEISAHENRLQNATGRAATLERELASVTALYRMIESSRSWRWLAPLRKTKAAMSHAVSWLVALPRNVARVSLHRAVTHLHAHPKRKAFVKRRLSRWRRLDTHVRRLAGLGPPQTVARNDVAGSAHTVSHAAGNPDALRRALATRIAHITELELHLERQTDRHQREMAELRHQIEQLRPRRSAESGR